MTSVSTLCKLKLKTHFKPSAFFLLEKFNPPSSLFYRMDMVCIVNKLEAYKWDPEAISVDKPMRSNTGTFQPPLFCLLGGKAPKCILARKIKFSSESIPAVLKVKRNQVLLTEKNFFEMFALVNCLLYGSEPSNES